jgi:hypothetical protein
MSPSLPSTVTGDVWGGQLNSFLDVSLNPADGTLSAAALAQIAATSAVDVTKHGVPTDGITDCVAPLKAIIASTVADAIADGSFYAEIFMPPGLYHCSGPLTQGGATKGNAQIPLPVIDPTIEKFTLVIRSGIGGGDSLPLWTQTVGQKTSGACLYTTLTGAYSATFGNPSVLGGPTSEQGYGNSSDSTFLFSNMHVVLDAVSVCSSTVNPTMTAFDFQGCAQLTVRSAGAFCDAPTLGAGGVGTVLPTHSSALGLHPPSQGNNDLNNIYSWSCEGYYTSLVLTEHCVVTRVCSVYCNRGLAISAQGYAHGNVVLYASIESCLNYVVWDTYTHAIIIDLDVEHNHGTVFDGGPDISEATAGIARGYVGFEVSGGGEGEGTEPVVIGCLGLKINNIGRKAATANTADGFPSPPASGVAFKNPFWKDSFVAISGGTITGYAVDCGGIGGPRTLGVTGPQIIPLPSGAAITITYTGTISWVWTLI